MHESLKLGNNSHGGRGRSLVKRGKNNGTVFQGGRKKAWEKVTSHAPFLVAVQAGWVGQAPTLPLHAPGLVSEFHTWQVPDRLWAAPPTFTPVPVILRGQP